MDHVVQFEWAQQKEESTTWLSSFCLRGLRGEACQIAREKGCQA
jgi:hypothetical protein